ncbi:BgTH12-06474 [Blumeria graminis f. sp. triticale]|uniref:BgTH12-06474 n=1 Tax=Blumeria graminis f. sp. triticale TaxID=1689686 RepID=A0A9W4GCQ9_BLUGR|nr:BgTH12-06474 [Blumeria graminis f. sp. triticale]
MKCWAQIITTPTADTPGTTILLHFDNKRYLFGNVAEGTQRAAVQRKLGLIKVGDIFLTGRLGWDNAGGLLGMILTLADIRSSSREEKKGHGQDKIDLVDKDMSLSVHGGRNLTHLLATSRRFIFRKGMPIVTNEYTLMKEKLQKSWEPTWRDENIKVWAMAIESDVTVRKRSHAEFSDHIQDQKSQCELDEHDTIRKSVVSSMFDSSWRLDTLIKKKLSEVQLPAAIFHRGENGRIQKYEGPTVEEDASVADLEVLVRNPWPGALTEHLPSTTPSNTSICYIVKNYDQRGRFDPKKAKDLGITPGPDFRRLTQGESITTTAGRIVSPDMVLGKGKNGSGFAVIELPRVAYLESLLARKEFSSSEVMLGVGVIFWILGPEVVHDTRLQKFMKDRSEMKHIISSSDYCPNYLALESAAMAAIRLNLLDPNHFPLPDYSNQVDPIIQGLEQIERAQCGMVVQLEPLLEVQRDSIIPLLKSAIVVQGAPKNVLELAEVARSSMDDVEYLATLERNQADIPCKDAEVTTLGTGSSLPSKYRNVSATLIRVPGYGNYLLDCGENTLGQLKRVFGKDLPDVLRNLKTIWISHLHADHHLGTVNVIKAWHEATRDQGAVNYQKLIVASDRGMTNWLREYAEVEDYGYNRVEPVTLGSRTTFSFKPSQELVSHTGFNYIEACQVEHCAGALAVVFGFPNGFKFAYSGDCRPSERFVRIGQGATLLIHEATFDDELRGDAVAKKHSTTSEALDIGKRMNARRILLTHFSQRYQKIPIMNCKDGKSQVAIVAFDYMKIRIEDFVKMEALKPALMKLYEGKEE